MMESSAPLIALTKVGRLYRTGGAEVHALRNVSLTISAGEFVAIMGPSGSGKTTLMNIIGCLDRPSSGQYLFQGKALERYCPDERARLRREAFGFVFQNYNLLGMASARENVEMPAVYVGTPKSRRRTRAEQLLNVLGLSHRMEHQPGELSGGEQQRVAIARALMNGGRVVLADEPTGSVDSRTGREIISQLRSLAEQGHTVVLVTHDPDVAAQTRRCIRLLDGRVVEDSGATEDTPRRAARSPYQGTALPTGRLAWTTSLREAGRAALRTLRGNRFRTALTLLGIVIGVFSVTAMLAVAENARKQMLTLMNSLGGENLTVTPGMDANQGVPVQSLTLADAEAIRDQVPQLVSVTPIMRGGGTLAAGGEQAYVLISALPGWAVPGLGQRLEQGVFFTDAQSESYAPVAVVGHGLVDAQSGPQVRSVGQHVLINGAPFQVIGFLRRVENAGFLRGGTANTVYVPLHTAAARLFGRDYLDSIQVVVEGRDHVDAAIGHIHALLTQRHGAQDFRIRNEAELLAVQEEAADITRLLLGAIGAISLVVAGIGVMNIMLASVAERTREIGLRMAIGARQRDIWQQFLCEAVVVCGFGGLIGLLLALGLGGAVSGLGISAMAFTPPILLIGLSCATLTGLLFGFAPARRAAKLDPVVALAAQ